MPEVKKSDIRFESSNPGNTVAGYYYTCPEQAPRAILQISHGMCEYIGRYDDFAGYMAQNGYVVCGNDHLGHGVTSSGANGTDGFFAEKDGCGHVLRDLNRMNGLAREAYPGLPLILLGHSMGSFFARAYAVRYPDTLDALVLSGTGGPNPMAGVGAVLTKWIGKLKGAKHRSQFLNNMAFGQYLKRVENPATPYDWISRDAQIVAKYAADEKCTFIFTASAFHDLMTILQPRVGVRHCKDAAGGAVCRGYGSGGRLRQGRADGIPHAAGCRGGGCFDPALSGRAARDSERDEPRRGVCRYPCVVQRALQKAALTAAGPCARPFGTALSLTSFKRVGHRAVCV